MIDTMGVILTANNDCEMGELTRVRSVAAIPFAGRYRLVDFVLSNMVNSGIINVGVATDFNYQSLMDHLGSGKPWGLARKKYGLTFLPPFQANNSSADERLKMLTSIIHYIKRSQQKYVVVADCNNVCNMTFDSVVEQHIESGAELTIIYAETTNDGGMFVSVDDEGNVKGLTDKLKGKMGKKTHRLLRVYKGYVCKCVGALPDVGQKGLFQRPHRLLHCPQQGNGLPL